MTQSVDIRELNELIERKSAFVTNLVTGMNQVIIGQKHFKSLFRFLFFYASEHHKSAYYRCNK